MTDGELIQATHDPQRQLQTLEQINAHLRRALRDQQRHIEELTQELAEAQQQLWQQGLL